MMKRKDAKIGVLSRSFSNNKVLREKLTNNFQLVKFNDTNKTLSGNDLVEFAIDCDGLVVGMELITPAILDHLKKLKVISKYGVGTNNIPLEELKNRNIKFHAQFGTNSQSVAELTLFMMIGLCHKTHLSSENVKKSIWQQSIGTLLQDKTIGIIGYGNAGQSLRRLLIPFRSTVLVNDIKPLPNSFSVTENIKVVEKDEIYSSADIITVHTPLDSSTKGMIGSNEMAQMKKGVFIVNCARGGIVCEKSLNDFLNVGHIEGAGLDVLEDEINLISPIINNEKVLITSHIGGSSIEAILAMGDESIAGLLKFFK